MYGVSSDSLSTSATGAAAVSSSTPDWSASLCAQFVSAYYHALANDTAQLYSFYEDDSVMVRADEAEAAASSQVHVGQLAIHDKVMSMGYEKSKVKVESTDIMETVGGGVMLLVTGVMVLTGQSARAFVQSFLLMPAQGEESVAQPRFYVRNDVLRLLAPILSTPAAPPATSAHAAQPTAQQQRGGKGKQSHAEKKAAAAAAHAAAATPAQATSEAAPASAAAPAPAPAAQGKAARGAPAKQAAAKTEAAAESKTEAKAAAPAANATPSAATTQAKPTSPAAAPTSAAAASKAPAPVTKPPSAATPAAKPAPAAPIKPTSWAARLASNPASQAQPLASPTASPNPVTPVQQQQQQQQAPKPQAQQPQQSPRSNGMNAAASSNANSGVDDQGFKTVGKPSRQHRNKQHRQQKA